MGIAGNGAIDAPQVAAPRVGLLASANVIEDSPEPRSDANPTTDWRLGFSWNPEQVCIGDGQGVFNPCGSDTKDAGDNPEVLLYDPFGVWASDECSGFDISRDRIGRARRRLLACQSKIIAHEFWTGEMADADALPNRFLASPTANTVTNGSVSEANALACLEEALADCVCGTGMIHVTPGLMTHLAAAQVIQRFGNVFRTANDTIVVADKGYDGSGPDGQPAADGSVWAYGTDIVTVRLSSIDVLPSDDPEDPGSMAMESAPTNTITFIAERLAAVTFDACCHVAAEVNINTCADLVAS